jgi:hypothetical protein
MSSSFRLFLVVGFLLQILGRYLAVKENQLPIGIQPFHLMIAGIVIFTLGSLQYARSKRRLWTWGLFGIVLPFFLIVVLIPRRLPPEE